MGKRTMTYRASTNGQHTRNGDDRNYIRLDCDCGFPIRASWTTFERGGLACMICGKFFTVTS